MLAPPITQLVALTYRVLPYQEGLALLLLELSLTEADVDAAWTLAREPKTPKSMIKAIQRSPDLANDSLVEDALQTRPEKLLDYQTIGPRVPKSLDSLRQHTLRHSHWQSLFLRIAQGAWTSEPPAHGLLVGIAEMLYATCGDNREAWQTLATLGHDFNGTVEQLLQQTAAINANR